MSQVAEPIKWSPVLGQMNAEDVKGLDINMVKSNSYHCIAPFGTPLILQREGGSWNVMPKAVQDRAFNGTGLRRWS